MCELGQPVSGIFLSEHSRSRILALLDAPVPMALAAMDLRPLPPRGRPAVFGSIFATEALIFAAPIWAGAVGRPTCPLGVATNEGTLPVNIAGELTCLGFDPCDRAHPPGQMSRLFRYSNQLQSLEMGGRRRAQNLDRIAEGSDDFLPLMRSYA